MKRKFILDYEVVDNITAQNLEEIYHEISKDLIAVESGKYDMHVDDYAYYKQLQPALALIVKHFGRSVD